MESKTQEKGGEHAMKMNGLDWAAGILLIIGGLNWGLVGFFEYDLVASIFGELSAVAKVVYALVGLSALYMIFKMPMKSKSAPAV